MMARRLIVLGVLAVLLGGLLLVSQWQGGEPRVSGTVEADEIRIGSRVGGRVARVLVDEGQQVSPGEVLVELEPFDLREQRIQAESELRALRAQYEALATGYRPEEVAQARAQRDQLAAKLLELENGPRPQEIVAAEARLAVAEAEVELAELSYRRMSQVVASRAGTQEELDNAAERLKSARAQVVVRQQEVALMREGARKEAISAARAQLAEAEQALQLREKGYRAEEIEAAKARVDAASGALAALDRRLEELTIKSPVSGVIEALELQPGDLVAANAPVLSLLDTRRMWVRTYIPGNRLDVEPGTRVRVRIDAYPGEEFEGCVTFVARAAEFTPRNVQTPEERLKQVFRAKVEILHPTRPLRPGMGADIWLGPSP